MRIVAILGLFLFSYICHAGKLVFWFYEDQTLWCIYSDHAYSIDVGGECDEESEPLPEEGEEENDDDEDEDYEIVDPIEKKKDKVPFQNLPVENDSVDAYWRP